MPLAKRLAEASRMPKTSLGGCASAAPLCVLLLLSLTLQRPDLQNLKKKERKQMWENREEKIELRVCAQKKAQMWRGEVPGEEKQGKEWQARMRGEEGRTGPGEHAGLPDDLEDGLVSPVVDGSTCKRRRKEISTAEKPKNQSTPHDYKKLLWHQERRTVSGHLSVGNMASPGRIPKARPTFSYVGNRDLSNPEATSARLRLDSHTKQFYDFFYEIYQRGRIIPTFRQNLSQAQSQYLIFVRHLTDWTDTDEAVTFQQEVDIYKFISFDLEQIKPNKEAVARIPLFKRRRVDQDRCVYAIFGTITGRVVIFDLESCFGGPVSAESPLDPVPPEFHAWIKSPEVIVAGSGVDRDLEDAGIEAHKVINMQTVFSRHLVAKDDKGPLIDLGNNRRSGLGIQAYYAKDLDYKPMPAKKYVDAYGPHRYRDDGGRLKWPAWRHHDHLYRWPKDREGNLRQESLFYMWHDGSCPASVVAKIFLDTCQREPIVVKESNVAELLDAWLGPDFLRIGGLDILHINEPALEEELWEDTGEVKVEVIEPEVQPRQEQVSFSRVERKTTGSAKTALCSRSSRKGRSQTRSRSSTFSRRKRSSGRASRGTARSSPTGTGEGKGKTLTSQIRVWPDSASIVRKESIPISTKVAPSCARTPSKMREPTTPAPTRDARTGSPTGSPPAGCSTTAAASATTGATTRRPGVGSGRARSGSGRATTSRPMRIWASSPLPAGGTSVGDGGATFARRLSLTSPHTRSSSRWTSARWTGGSDSGRGFPGRTGQEESPSGMRTEEKEDIMRGQEESGGGSEKRKREEETVTVSGQESSVRLFYSKFAFSYSNLCVVCEFFIQRFSFYSEYNTILLYGLRQSSLAITRSSLVPVAYQLTASNSSSILSFVSNSNNRSSSLSGCDQVLRVPAQSRFGRDITPQLRDTLETHYLVTGKTQQRFGSCFIEVNKVCILRSSPGWLCWWMTSLHKKQQLTNSGQEKRRFGTRRMQRCCGRSSEGSSSPPRSSCQVLTRGVWRQDQQVSLLRSTTRRLAGTRRQETLLADLSTPRRGRVSASLLAEKRASRWLEEEEGRVLQRCEGEERTD